MSEHRVYTIAGSDSSGGAGLQADWLTFHQFGVRASSVITAVTAQNNQEIRELTYLDPEIIAAQLQALQTALPARALKIGMLGTVAAIKTLRQALTAYNGLVVLDPLLTSSSGRNLFAGEASVYLAALRELFTVVDVLTPNVAEAEKILNRELKTTQALEEGAAEILALGPKSVLIKGGHFKAGDLCQDYWTDGQTAFWLAAPRLEDGNRRGTGCALSAALTACLALGEELKDALVLAKMYVNRGIRKAQEKQAGAALLYHGGWPEEECDLPYLFSQAETAPPPSFPPLDFAGPRLYPIVDSFAWVEKLLPCGVELLQLRIKDKTGAALENEIKNSIALAKEYQAKLFINDYWDLALQHGAYGVHLGQGDLAQADLASLRQAGLRLGVSTHCYYEVARAHAIRPSYLACGPIFPTTSKIMPFSPQGVARLKRWRRTLNYPLVAIGGINQERIPEILATGVDGVALISALTQAQDPLQAATDLLMMVKRHATHAA